MHIYSIDQKGGRWGEDKGLQPVLVPAAAVVPLERAFEAASDHVVAVVPLRGGSTAALLLEVPALATERRFWR